ncbi:MAG: hypothetical protein P8X70_02405 [Nanoarchaeota archaeon]
MSYNKIRYLTDEYGIYGVKIGKKLMWFNKLNKGELNKLTKFISYNILEEVIEENPILLKWLKER